MNEKEMNIIMMKHGIDACPRWIRYQYQKRWPTTNKFGLM